MKTFEILKKNRKYFAATVNGCKCKLLIDEQSENLPIGTAELEVDDISVRSKYGTDLIFKVKAELKKGAICTLKHDRYNSKLVERCKELGGKWDSYEYAWIFSDIVEDKVEELDCYYNENMMKVEITFLEDYIWGHQSAKLVGYPIATATGRDSGATMAENVALVAGRVTSGGSRVNWSSIICEGAVIRMTVSESVFKEIEELGKERELLTIKENLVKKYSVRLYFIEI